MAVLTDEETALIGWVAGAAAMTRSAARNDPTAAEWTHLGTHALLIERGRLFTAPEHPRAALGRAGECWANATYYAEDHEPAVYVEGLVVQPGHAGYGMDTPHAWCAVDSMAIEPSPGWAPGSTYLGLPLADDYRRELQHRYGIGSLLWDSRAARDLMRHGIPDDALVDVGRPVPHLAHQNDWST